MNFFDPLHPQPQSTQENLPPGTTLITNAAYMEKQSMRSTAGQQYQAQQYQSQQQQQQQFQSSYQQQQNGYLQQSSSQGYQSFTQQSLSQPLPQPQSQAPMVQAPMVQPQMVQPQYQTPPQPQPQQQQQQQKPLLIEDVTPQLNILSHVDGAMLLQEVFLTNKSLSKEGLPSVIELQGIWGKANGKMLLSLRMQNNPDFGVDVDEFLFSFGPNAFGLVADMNLEPFEVANGQTGGQSLTLSLSDSNQQIPMHGKSIASLEIQVEYTITAVNNAQKTKRLHFTYETEIPMHLFFHDHPQRYTVNNGIQNGQLLDFLSCTDDGPRMNQNSFLSGWQSEAQCIEFAVTGVSTDRWMQMFQMPLQKAIEHKLAINRIYNVATREVSGDMVMYVSFRIGVGAGKLLMAEVRFGSSECTMVVKGQLNAQLTSAVEKSLKAILMS